MMSFDSGEEVSPKDDYPKWKDGASSTREIQIEILSEVDPERDTGFYRFLTKQLSLEDSAEVLTVAVSVTHGSDRTDPTVNVTCAEKDYDGLEAQEVLKRLQTSRTILFHNSTQADPRFPFQSQFGGVIRAATSEGHEEDRGQGTQQDLQDAPARD